MAISLIGKKMGMTRVFAEDGASVPVTVVHVPANFVTQVKTPDSDGYLALQLATGKWSRANKPAAGHFKRANVSVQRSLRESRITEEEMRKNGDRVGISSFSVGEKVNVVGVSKGKGFAGVIKRHHFKSQDATHGNSLSHRSGGSIGQCQTPGKVFKGKKMAGHLGSHRVTVKNLKVVQIDEERELLLLEGAVPGARGGEVLVKHLVPVPPEEMPAEAADQQEAELATPDKAGDDSGDVREPESEAESDPDGAWESADAVADSEGET